VNESNTLLTLAEVSVAFAGFASLVGILGHATSAADPRVLSLRMRAMLLASLLVVAFSLIPVIVSGYGAAPHLAWTASTLLLLGATLGYGRWLQLAIIALGRAGLTTNRFQRRVIVPTLMLTLVAAALLLLVNVLVAMPAIYLTALALLLFQSGFAFCLIVFSFLPQIESDLDET
jgi:hypothetical protein